MLEYMQSQHPLIISLKSETMHLQPDSHSDIVNATERHVFGHVVHNSLVFLVGVYNGHASHLLTHK